MIRINILIRALIITLAGCSDPEPPQPTAKAVEESRTEESQTLYAQNEAESRAMDDAREAVKAHFLSGQEPTAKDATWTADDIFKVAVVDTGADRSGYAEYVCSVLKEHGFKNEVWVQIVDIEKIVREKSFVKLGESTCNFT